MNTKAKGSRNERRSRDYLTARGFTVIKAGASLGCFDLLAYDGERILFIQCKTNGPPPPAEREAMRLMLVPPNGFKYIHIWHDGQPSKPEIREVSGEEAKRRASFEAERIRADRNAKILAQLERGGLDTEAMD